jgi:hypothetical protein
MHLIGVLNAMHSDMGGNISCAVRYIHIQYLIFLVSTGKNKLPSVA